MSRRMSPSEDNKFTKNEIDYLNRNFYQLAGSNEKIDRTRFRDLLTDDFEIDDSLLMDRVFRCLDLDSDNYINHDEFMRGMSILLKGTIEEKMKFCFRVYDLNGDNYISKEEMYQMLKNTLIRVVEEDEDGVKELVEIILKKMDIDHDGRVSEMDWYTTIEKDNLLLEAFGKCLANEKAIERYLLPAYDECEAEESPKKLLSFPHINLNQFDPRNLKRKQIFDTYTNGLTLPAVTPGKSIVEKQDEENAEVTEENGEATDQPNTAAPATAAH
ncbi:EF-hand [Neocallimastix lanati (nom. inval.)]|jgi:Ca2+-binding EF-hand superfamily protein|uniref:EF-hand n=1 Tax=Neocallimastix californiae TaxID=1754190 RepID=A0A1Y2CLR6_9FUNG|nr:EF-hand [Neocallimastix sp. JGI-2020a]ORY47961.1 EF-hand [Neocallimastix californiae]|eukprot:ORY47961.1 EF-hand [Neocallimastix californiae]